MKQKKQAPRTAEELAAITEYLAGGPCQMTARPRAKCSFCKRPLAGEAIGNPTWPWKTSMGHGCWAYCSKACMDWSLYRVQLKRIVGSCRQRHMSEEEIQRRVDDYDRYCVNHGTMPEGPEPERLTIDSTNGDEVKIRYPSKSVVLGKKSAYVVKENVDVDEYIHKKEEQTMDEQEKVTPAETAQEALETADIQPAQAEEQTGKTQESASLNFQRRSLRVVSVKTQLCGNYVDAIIDKDGQRVLLDLCKISGAVDEQMVSELEELVQAVKEAVSNG